MFMGKNSAATSVAVLEKGRIKRVLGLWDLFAIGYGDLGSSIYYAMGITALYALGATPLVLAIAGVVFICTALSYAELGSIYHESGGSASFARHVFNDLISFISGWGLLLDYIVTIAISAFAIAPYLAIFLPHLADKFWHIGFTSIIIFVLLAINFFGVRHSTRISLVLALIAIVTQLIIIVFGLIFALDFVKVFSHIKIGVSGVSWSPSWSEFFRGLAMAMVAYTGIESIAQLGSESTKPAKNLPKAIIINIVALGILYMGISIVGLSILTPQQLSTTYVTDPLAGIAHALPFGGTWLASWIGLLAAILLFVASNAGLIGSSRLAYNLGEYYQLPRFFSKLHPKFRTPYVSLIFFALLAVVIIAVSFGDLSKIADLYNFGAMIAYFSTNLSLIVLRIKKPELTRPFKVALNIPIKGRQIPLTAVIGCLATLAIWIIVVITKPDGRYLGLAWMVVGISMFLLYRRKKGLTTKGSLSVEKIKLPHFQPFELKRMLVPIQGVQDYETVQMACELAALHKTEISFIHILEIPHSLPIDTPFAAKTAQGELLLKHAEAFARNRDLPVDTEVLYGRTFDETVLTAAKAKKIDLIVLSWTPSGKEKQLMSKSPCRIWLCSH